MYIIYIYIIHAQQTIIKNRKHVAPLNPGVISSMAVLENHGKSPSLPRMTTPEGIEEGSRLRILPTKWGYIGNNVGFTRS